MLRSAARRATASASVLFVLSLASVGTMGGCEFQERFAYRSDAYSPKTVSIVDTTSGSPVVTIDVPVGQQLNMVFDRLPDAAEQAGTDTLRYAIKPWGDTSLTNASSVSVPPPSMRRIDVSLRPVPEQPPAAPSAGGK